MADSTPAEVLRCPFCRMLAAKVTDLEVDLRVTLRADVKHTLYGEVYIPTCVKHENIYIIHMRTRT